MLWPAAVFAGRCWGGWACDLGGEAAIDGVLAVGVKAGSRGNWSRALSVGRVHAFLHS